MIDTGELYLTAALETLRKDRTLFPSREIATASCLIMPDDKTPPNAGRLFIGMRVNNQQAASNPANRLDEEVGIMVAVTLRTSDTASDRMGNRTVRREETRRQLSIYEVKELVLKSLHNTNEVLRACQELILAREGEPIEWPALTPLNYRSAGGSGPQVVGPGHFGADNPEGRLAEGRSDSGLLLKLIFGGGRRYRLL
jgi:hypothetical protein